MSKNNVIVASTKAASKLVRARFGPGMLLQHEDLEQLNAYTRDLNRLMFRSLFGCGVICGLRVSASPKCGKVEVTVAAGVALACSGDPVHVPKDLTFALDEACDDIPSSLWVVLCGTVKSCAPRTAICSDDDEAHCECTRERYGFEIRVVRERPKYSCACPEPADDREQISKSGCNCADPNLPCYENHYEGTCGCNCDGCSDCDCQCILLARLDRLDGRERPWQADHRVRRFIRPVLMRDPVVAAEEAARRENKGEAQGAAAAQIESDEQLVMAAEEETPKAVEKKEPKRRRGGA